MEASDATRRLTATQSDVLEVLRQARRPLTAYEVLSDLRRTRATATPPVAYRALARLIALGLAHRLESLNAYLACCAEHDVAPVFAICDACGTVSEHLNADLTARLERVARLDGFTPTASVIEVHGRCGPCREAS